MTPPGISPRPALSRRAFLQGGGALVVAFGLPIPVRAQTATPAEKLSRYASLDAWLAVGQDGGVTVFTGKVELGTGVETALSQIVAEELDVAIERVTIVQGDTGRTPDQGLTTGSKTIDQGGPQLRQAAAEARQALLEMAASRLGAPVERLEVAGGAVGVAGDASRTLTYGELIGGRRFDRAVGTAVTPKSPDTYRVVGTPARRVDIPTKVTGVHEYVHNVRRPGMVHGRVVRPFAVGATLESVDERSVRRLPGPVKVVTRGNFVAVVAEREELAIRAARELKVAWKGGGGLPETADLYRVMRNARAGDKVLVARGDVGAALGAAARRLRATYEWPFQMHASVGPSCAVAEVRDGRATIWCASQGVFGLRDALARLLGLAPEHVRVIFAEAAGCYGHNGADDVAADAALLAQAVGRPVRVQWMRHDEHGWEPKGPSMVMEVRGGLDAGGAVVAWDYAVWTPTHSTRPRGEPGNTLAGQLLGLAPRHGATGGDRNADHTYVFPNDRVVVHWLARSPLRPSALRGLGAPQNTFANESFMDELAAAAGADPVEFRLRHLEDPRAIAVVEAAAKLAGWQSRPSPRPAAAGGGAAPGGGTTGDRTAGGSVGSGTSPAAGISTGRGFAYAQYENRNAYVAMVAEVEVDRRTGAVHVRRAWVAHDCGLIVNPDGVRNQIEGNVVQTISRTLKEEVRFDRAGVKSLDWRSYPILTFAEAPDDIEIALINRPDQRPVGAGEPAACPVPAAIANAVFDATGVRLRTVPFTPERVRAALEAAPRG